MKEVGKAYSFSTIHTPKKISRSRPNIPFQARSQELRSARRREGSYLLRSNIKGDDPGKLWRLYLQLVEIEQAFKELKNDLSIRPIRQVRDPHRSPISWHSWPIA